MTLRSLIPFFVALVGVALLFWSFASGIAAALDGSGSGSAGWQLVFVLALLAVIAAIVLSIVNLVKKRDAVVSVATLFVTAVPLVIVLILVVAIAAPGN